ncbi:hypothetical protein SVIOM342S_07532 [Streptomyces violaceorubidus]
MDWRLSLVHPRLSGTEKFRLEREETAPPEVTDRQGVSLVGDAYPSLAPLLGRLAGDAGGGGPRGAVQLVDRASGETVRTEASFGEEPDPATADRPVRTTLDAGWQSAAERALGEADGKNAALVALRVDNGEVLALANSPSSGFNRAAPPPSSSQITVTGSGSAYRATRSAVPGRGSASSSSCAMRSTRGRRAAVRPGVKCPATRRRRRVCCGGSLWSMLWPMACPPSLRQDAECRMSLRSRGSASAARAASRVTTSQLSPLPGTSTRCTAPSARRAASSSGEGAVMEPPGGRTVKRGAVPISRPTIASAPGARGALPGSYDPEDEDDRRRTRRSAPAAT